MFYHYFDTPAGRMLLVSNGKNITSMYWTVFKRAVQPAKDWIEKPELFTDAVSQFEEYFAGTRTNFSLSHLATGTLFQQAVWKEIDRIPYGSTTTYQAIAKAIGKPKAVRAVGTAVGSNPMSIVVPCHRVLASNGGMGGYAGGLESKILLLNLEKQRKF